MNHKMLIIVPYRDREEHLKQFVCYTKDNIKNIDYDILIVEQDFYSPFNRGLLLNLGFSFFSQQYSYICLHDVDMIGENFDYSYSDTVTHLSDIEILANGQYREWYGSFLGGVTLFPTHLFAKINGFSNKYWGWGAEDDDLKLRCDSYNLKIIKRNQIYKCLPHERNVNRELYKKNYNRFITNWRTKPEDRKQSIITDGLSNCKDFLKEYDISTNSTYTVMRVNIIYDITKI